MADLFSNLHCFADILLSLCKVTEIFIGDTDVPALSHCLLKKLGCLRKRLGKVQWKSTGYKECDRKMKELDDPTCYSGLSSALSDQGGFLSIAKNPEKGFSKIDSG